MRDGKDADRCLSLQIDDEVRESLQRHAAHAKGGRHAWNRRASLGEASDLFEGAIDCA